MKNHIAPSGPRVSPYASLLIVGSATDPCTWPLDVTYATGLPPSHTAASRTCEMSPAVKGADKGNTLNCPPVVRRQSWRWSLKLPPGDVEWTSRVSKNQRAPSAPRVMPSGLMSAKVGEL